LIPITWMRAFRDDNVNVIILNRNNKLDGNIRPENSCI
jgi:hypothetical protein